jgi:tape measure domain-containing protein
MADDLNLTLKVTADTQKAIAPLEQLENAVESVDATARDVGDAANTAGAGFEDMGEAAGETAGQIDGVVDAARAVGDATRDAASGLEAISDASGAMAGIGERADKTASGFTRMRDEAARARQGIGQIGPEAYRSGMKAGEGIKCITDQLRGLQLLAGAGLGVRGFSDLIRIADEYGQMASRIRMATKSTEEYEAVQARLLETASNTYRPLAEAQEMYLRTADALKSLGYDTEQALDVSDSFSYLMVTNAASGERAASAISAYSKALQKGKIDAEAWQSILAATPTLVDKIAEATGMTTEEIRRMGAEGQLALADMNEGLRQSLAKNMEDAAEMPTTVADAFTNLSNRLQAYLGQANEATGATEQVTSAIGGLANHISSLVTGGFYALAGALTSVAVSMARSAAGLARMTVARVAATRAEQMGAQAALAAAEAEMAAAQAALAHARAAVNTGMAVSVEAGAYARAEAASLALTAARARAAAASGVMMTGLKGIGAFLAGPWGMALAAATLGLSLFREKSEAVKSSLSDLGAPLDAVREKFAAMGRATQAGELVALKREAEAAKTAMEGIGRGLAKSIEHELTGWFKRPSQEARAEMEAIQSEVRGLAAGTKSNFAGAVGMVESALHIPASIRNEWLVQLGNMETARRMMDGLQNRQGILSGDKSAAEGLAKTEKSAAELAAQLKGAQEAAKALGVDLAQFSSAVSPEFEAVNRQLETLIAALGQLEKAGVDTGAALGAAFSKAIAGARNPAELMALTDKVEALGKTGELAKPKMVELFQAIRDKAREAGGEAGGLKKEIDDLLAQARRIRAGEMGLAAEIEQSLKKDGKSNNLSEVNQAVADAGFWSSAAKSASLDGRTEDTAKYAQAAAGLMCEVARLGLTGFLRFGRLFVHLAKFRLRLPDG